MPKYKDIEQGQGLVVMIIILLLAMTVASTLLSYWFFTPQKYTEFIKSIMIMMQAPEEAMTEVNTAIASSFRQLDRNLYNTMQLYGSVFNFVFMLLLCIFLYLGRAWARCLISIILLLGAPGSLLAGYLLFNTQTSTSIGLFLLMYGLISIICTAILLFSSKVRAYAAYMRGA